MMLSVACNRWLGKHGAVLSSTTTKLGVAVVANQTHRGKWRGWPMYEEYGGLAGSLFELVLYFVLVVSGRGWWGCPLT
jgi:hypothetical protein